MAPSLSVMVANSFRSAILVGGDDVKSTSAGPPVEENAGRNAHLRRHEVVGRDVLDRLSADTLPQSS